MKLLIYSHHFAPSVGGVESSVLALATGLAGRKSGIHPQQFEVVVVTQTEAGHFDDGQFPFRVERKPSLFRLSKLIRDHEVVHVAGPAMMPVVLAKLLRRPVVVEHHGYQAICPNGALWEQPSGLVCPGHFQAGNYSRCVRCCRAESSSWYRGVRAVGLTGLRGWLCRFTENIAISQHVSRRHGHLNMRVIYYGIADPYQGSVQPQAAHDLAPPISFAYVGRLVPEKGVAVLLAAAAILKGEGFKFEVVIVGDGPQRRELQEQVRVNGLEGCTRFTGFLRGGELAEALRKVHAVVMPSVVEETAGLAAIEQMMRARLVIVASIGGLQEVVGDAGLQFPVRDARALAERMKKVIAKPEMVSEFGRIARSRAEQLFTLNRFLDEHAGLYYNLAEGET